MEPTSLLDAAGGFIWPLAACSCAAAYVTVERALALRDGRTLPDAAIAAVREGRLPAADPATVAGRLVAAWKAGAGPEGLRAAAAAEVVRLQRGLFLLDSAVALAPLLGLLGTVVGLAGLFSGGGLPGPERLTEGFGLALSTTMIGLGVAIPAQLAANWLARRVEVLAARIGVLAEALERAPRA